MASTADAPVRAQASGKLILLGEHAVVYGQPALALPLGAHLWAQVGPDPQGPRLHLAARGWTVQADGLVVAGAPPPSLAQALHLALTLLHMPAAPVRIELGGELPLGVGLGGSAALSVALLRALDRWRIAQGLGAALSTEQLLAAALRLETVFHGRPSGLDHTVIVRGQAMRFQRCGGGELRAEPLILAAPVPVVVGYGPRTGSTHEAVARVARRQAECPALTHVHEAIGALIPAAQEALSRADWATLGQLFDINHGLLSALGVCAAENDRMVHIARAEGALGAKLTGAGLGGAVVALSPDRGPQIAQALRAAGFEAFATTLGGDAAGGAGGAARPPFGG